MQEGITPKGLDEGAPLFANPYDCPVCGRAWDDIWDCGCDDECATCGLTVSPTTSELIRAGSNNR